MKKINFLKSIIFLVILISSNGSNAQTTVTFRPNAAAGKDALVDSYSTFANNNYGSTEEFEYGTATDGGIQFSIRDFLQFDVTSIPTGKYVVSAYLTLYYRGANPTNLSGVGHYNFNDNPSYIEKIAVPWNESTITWNNQPAVDTTGRLSIPSTGSDTASLYNYDITSFVQQWVSSPLTNYGMRFRIVNETPYRAVKYYSSDAPNNSVRPKLVVTYANCPVPAATVTPSGNISYCAGSDALLMEATSANCAYQWKKNGSNIPGATGHIYSAKTPGTYKCVVTNACGHSASSNAVNVTKIPLASVTVSAAGPVSFCAGNSVLLNATNPGAGYSSQWYRNNIAILGATGLSYTAYSAGTYRIAIVNSSSGCSRLSNTITVTINCRLTPLLYPGMITQEENMNVFPNPASGIFSIEINDSDNNDGNAEIKMFSMLGKQVYFQESKMVNGYLKTTINADKKFQNGLYILNVTVNGKNYKNKLMIQ